MANSYRGNQHKHGVVIGSFIDALIAIIVGCFLFKVTIYAGLAAFFLAIFLVAFGLDNHYFGRSIKYSKKYKRSDNDTLNKTLFWIMVVSMIIFILLFIITLSVL